MFPIAEAMKPSFPSYWKSLFQEFGYSDLPNKSRFHKIYSKKIEELEGLDWGDDLESREKINLEWIPKLRKWEQVGEADEHAFVKRSCC